MTSKTAGDHRGHPPLLSCPSWARTRTLLIPYHFGLRRRLQRSWSGLCLHLRHNAVRWFPLPSLHLPLSGLGSALPVEGPPTSRTCTHAVSDVVSGVLPESGVLPVTPRGSVLLVPSTQVTARSRSRIRTWFTSSRARPWGLVWRTPCPKVVICQASAPSRSEGNVLIGPEKRL